MSTLRQIDLRSGTVFVGLDPEGVNVVMNITLSRLGGSRYGTKRDLTSMFGRGPVLAVSSVGPDFWAVGGVVPAGVVAVTVDGHAAELKTGAFIVVVDGEPTDPGVLLDRIELEYENNVIERVSFSDVDGSVGGSGSLTLTVDGRSASTPLTDVGCASTSGDPAAMAMRAAAGSLTDDDDFFHVACLDGDLRVDANVDGEFIGTSVEASNLDVEIIDPPGRLEITWDTTESSGQITVNCGDLIIDANNLAELLRES